MVGEFSNSAGHLGPNGRQRLATKSHSDRKRHGSDLATTREMDTGEPQIESEVFANLSTSKRRVS